jgi:hypothetical protein
MRRYWAPAAILVLIGCATVEDTKPTGPLSDVIVYREPSSRDGLFSMLLAVDDRVVAQLQPEEEYSFQLPAGNHRFEYELGLYNCSADVRIEPEKDYFIRLAQGCVIEPEQSNPQGGSTPKQSPEGPGPSGSP